MERRDFLKGLGVLGLCPLCGKAGLAAEGAHWSYEGDTGPAHWGELGGDNAVCGAGSQQSPLDLSGAVKADLPAIVTAWKKGGEIVNNGHTIQVNVPPGSMLTRGGRRYELLQYHFHAPSEHRVEGKAFPMEVHFVHKTETGTLGVLGVFVESGAANATFAALAASFPAKEGGNAPADGIDPNGLLPGDLGYWLYEGSLTTPPCSEVVEWMVAMQPIEVAAGDVSKFTDLYPRNARPVMADNRRFILSSR
jgi:carbonic anhydrase